MKIGFLEDDSDQASLVIRWLSDKGHRVVHAATGTQFLRLLETEVFDLVLLDWQVPELSGVEVLRHIRETMLDSVPVAFATQRKGDQDIVEALDRGADDYLVKPIRHRELLARINALQRRAGFDEDPEEL